MTGVPEIARRFINGSWVTGVADDSGGGSQAGAAIWRGPFTFAFDTPGLADGVEFYTPTVDDLIVEAVVFTDTIFDGTTPNFDIGTGLGGSVSGMFFDVAGAVNLTQQASDYLGDGGTLITPLVDNSLVGQGIVGQVGFGTSFPPALVGIANPLKAWVSQDGFLGGAAVGGAAGAGRLYISTVTPIAF